MVIILFVGQFAHSARIDYDDDVFAIGGDWKRHYHIHTLATYIPAMLAMRFA